MRFHEGPRLSTLLGESEQRAMRAVSTRALEASGKLPLPPWRPVGNTTSRADEALRIIRGGCTAEQV